MAHPEIILLTKVIEESNFRILEDQGIDRSYFATAEGRSVYDVIYKQYHTRGCYGSVPSMEVVQHRVRTFEPVPTSDAIKNLVDLVRQEKLRADILLLSDKLQDMATGYKLDEAIHQISTQAHELSTTRDVSRDLDLSHNVDVIKDRYLAAADGEGVLGIPYPWDPMTDATLGLQDGHFVLIYGRPGQLKTWLAVVIAAHCYLSGCRVLFYTREMTEPEILMRVAATVAGVDYDDFRKGRLPEALEIQTFEILDGLAVDEEVLASRKGGTPRFIKVTTADDVVDGNTVAGIRSKAKKYSADVIIADGVYRMGDIRTGSHSIDWQNVTHVSQDLKELAKSLKVPLVGVTQANRKHEMAFADALLQECDFAFRLVADKKKRLLYIYNGKLREGLLDTFAINAQPACNFSVVEFDPDEAASLADQDDAKASRGGGGGPRRGGRDASARAAPTRIFRR